MIDLSYHNLRLPGYIVMDPFTNSWEKDHLNTYLRPKHWRDLVKFVPLDMVTNMEAKMGDMEIAKLWEFF